MRSQSTENLRSNSEHFFLGDDLCLTSAVVVASAGELSRFLASVGFVTGTGEGLSRLSLRTSSLIAKRFDSLSRSELVM